MRGESRCDFLEPFAAGKNLHSEDCGSYGILVEDAAGTRFKEANGPSPESEKLKVVGEPEI